MIEICIGDVVRLRSWTHINPESSFTFKVPDKKRVAVFLLLGNENKDGSEPLDLEKRLNELGWIRDPALSSQEPQITKEG